MRAAVVLATAGTGATYPNPCVGAVVVQGGEVVGAGHSDATGGPHAEVRALAIAGERARGATVYVTLEPCAHFGRTPPCTDALIAAGVAEVVFGVGDPATHRPIGERGAQVLAAAGVRVRGGVALDACVDLHAHYLHHVTTRRPWVTLKAATSLDGRIAATGGDSRWITGEPARRVGHWLRARHHAIAVGADTVLRDDPQLSARLYPGVDPVPVIVDSRLRTADSRAPRCCVRARSRSTPNMPPRTGAGRSSTAASSCWSSPPTITAGSTSPPRSWRSAACRSARSWSRAAAACSPASSPPAAWDSWFWFQAPVLLGDGVPVLPGLQWSERRRGPAPARSSSAASASASDR
jgi:diaminohydroxyphosphoribosylaminopyrimidine deaminase/5-amino-6-(5-phosphoribosylamino)uracil reductase